MKHTFGYKLISSATQGALSQVSVSQNTGFPSISPIPVLLYFLEVKGIYLELLTLFFPEDCLADCKSLFQAGNKDDFI